MKRDLLGAVMAERDRAALLFERLREDGRADPGVSRDPYGAGEQRAHATVAEAAEALGLEISRDAAANLYMTLPGRHRAAPSVLIGSHLDSVPHGGNFDGAAGVVAGLITVAALRRLRVALSCDLTVMGIRAEESVWFQISYVGSRAALGTLPNNALDARRVDTGRTLAAHIADCGGDPEALAQHRRHLKPSGLRAYLELHIEQAPSLVEAGRAVAICTGIPGNFRYPNARIEGAHDHVGLPRRFRRDAAMAAAAFAMALDGIWYNREKRGISMACTFGRFHTDAAAHSLTIVPGAFHFSLDIRAYDSDELTAIEREMHDAITAIERERNVRFHLGPRASAAVGNVDPSIKAELAGAARSVGIPVIDLGSPASHDAAAFAAAGVPVGMLFVRNDNGSHNPREAMSLDDFLQATAVMVAWMVGTVIH